MGIMDKFINTMKLNDDEYDEYEDDYEDDDEVEEIPFKDLPEDWICPLCGAAKSEFVPQ